MTAATVAVPANSIYFGHKLSNVALTPYTMSHAWLTAETDETDDQVNFGYLPGGVVVVGMLNVCADLDSGNAIRHTISIGTTAIATADDLCSTGGGEAWWFTPIKLTEPTLVKVVITTGANTHVNGTQYLTFLYYSGQ